MTATDEGKPPLSASIILRIQILDENDNSPVFLHGDFTTSVKENLPVGGLITTVRATDADKGKLSGSVRYRLLRQKDPSPLQSQTSFVDGD